MSRQSNRVNKRAHLPVHESIIQTKINTRSKSISFENKPAFQIELNANYTQAHYLKIVKTPQETSGPLVTFEVEGIPLCSRGQSKEITYFECHSRRHRNAPECKFRARSKNFDSSKTEGIIEIISNHSPSCK